MSWDRFWEFWDGESLLGQIFATPAPTAAEKALSENIRLRRIKRTREIEDENAELRKELGL